MALQQVKVDVVDLRPGMYVANLDRPWIDTPFPLQGFYIDDYRDIEEVRRWCQHVFIDIERGKWPVAELNRHGSPDPGTNRDHRRPKVAPLKIRRGVYPGRTSLKKEIRKAEHLHERAGEAINGVMVDVRDGKRPDVSETRKVVSALVGSIIRNPDALVWLSRVKQRDQYSYDHSVRSAVWALIYGRHAGLAREALESLALGVLLAEVGKTRLPKELLDKPVLSPEEAEQVKKHSEYGVEILKSTPGINDMVIATVAARNERFDGSGYPLGLKGDHIPYLAKIAGLVGRYDGMLYPRDESHAMSPANAMTKLYELRDIEFQEELIAEFIRAVGLYPAGTLVELSTREVGVVLEQNENWRLRPKVMVLLDAEGQRLNKYPVVDLLENQAREKQRSLEILGTVSAGDSGIDPWQLHQEAFARRWSLANAAM